jgi:hypothetical protein
MGVDVDGDDGIGAGSMFLAQTANATPPRRFALPCVPFSSCRTIITMCFLIIPLFPFRSLNFSSYSTDLCASSVPLLQMLFFCVELSLSSRIVTN